MSNVLFTGIMPALYSVYDEDRNVIKPAVQKLVDYQLKNGVSGFYVGGNTGECAVLPNKTRKQMMDAVMEANNGRGKVIAHIGAGHIDDVYDLLDHANSLNVDAIASLPPSLQAYYGEDEILTYYRILAEKSKAPVLAYVTSVNTGDILEFAKRIMTIDNVIGIKMSIPDYFTFGNIKTINGGDINLLNGPDETLICGLAEGADGAIGTSYNALPKLAVSLYNNFKAGKMDAALECQRKINAYINLFLEYNIAFWKASMTFLGFDMGYTVEPQKLPDKETMEVLRKQLEKIGFFEMI